MRIRFFRLGERAQLPSKEKTVVGKAHRVMMHPRRKMPEAVSGFKKPSTLGNIREKARCSNGGKKKGSDREYDQTLNRGTYRRPLSQKKKKGPPKPSRKEKKGHDNKVWVKKKKEKEDKSSL